MLRVYLDRVKFIKKKKLLVIASFNKNEPIIEMGISVCLSAYLLSNIYLNYCNVRHTRCLYKVVGELYVS